MNRIELLVYSLVKNNPELKRRVVRAYQIFCGVIPQAAMKTDLRVITRPGFFFGFHDKPPFSLDDEFLLAHRNAIGDRSVRAGDRAEVGLFSGDGWREFTAIGVTKAWDWQLGSMLQWRGLSSEHVVFNDQVNGAIGSRIITRTGSEVSAFGHPVVHVSPDGQWASSYCFRRVAKAMPGYGARVAGDDEIPLHNFRCDDSADFRVFSLVDGSTRFAVSLDEIQRIEPHPSMDGAFHYFHHSLFNPRGTRLFFLHRWVDRNARRWTRMFSCDADGRNLFLFPTHEVVSHIAWIDDRTVLAYARLRETGDGYYILRDGDVDTKSIAQSTFNSDGHPTWHPSRGCFVTDTYPDRFRNQYLYLYGVRAGKSFELVRTHLPRTFLDDLQVDLHPRFNRAGSVVCFDSGHTGTRSLCTVNIEPVLQRL